MLRNVTDASDLSSLHNLELCMRWERKVADMELHLSLKNCCESGIRRM